MKAQFKIHRKSPSAQKETVTLSGGQTTEAIVPVLEIELVCISHPAFGSTKLGFIGADMQEADRAFQEGKTVTVEYTVDE